MENSANDSVTDSGNLLHNLALFGRLLRGLGLDVNPGRMIDLVEALSHIEIGRKNDFYHACRSLLVHNKGDIPLFDQAFHLFWQAPSDSWFDVDMSDLTAPTPMRKPAVVPPALQVEEEHPGEEDGDSPAGDEIPMLEVTRTFSSREVLRRKDFAEMSSSENEAVKVMMAQLIWHMSQRRSRRRQPGRGRILDLRRSLRRNLRYGGELLQWSYLKPKFRHRPLIVIADISGSMERYTRMLLHFIYALTKGLEQPVESFVFGTRLTYITHQLRDRDVDRALRHVSHAVADWSGGTRIGEALKSFNYDWARRVLGRGAVVLLISDGWDRGDPELLGAEIARLQRSCYRLIWLNPLLGSAEYEPLTRGMMAALPYVDDFLAVHNLTSLEDLADHMARLDSKRPMRRQQSHAAWSISNA